MPQIFGNFLEAQDSQEYLIIGFSPNSLPLQQRWRNNGLSANFLADYLTTFFPAYEISSPERQAEIKDAVAYVANELLENAMKYSYEPAQYPVSIGLHLEANQLRFYVTNQVDPATIDSFQEFIQELLSGDPGEMYIRQIEAGAEDEHTATSHLGFLTMLTDYGAELAWKFETASATSERIIVTTMVKLTI